MGVIHAGLAAMAVALVASAAPDEPGVDVPTEPAVDPEMVQLPDGDVLIEPSASRVGFAVRMRWFSRVEGHFNTFRGVVAAPYPDMRRVEVEVDSASVDVGGRARMTEWAASEEFFDVVEFPVIVFVSDLFAPELAVHGGELPGDLSLRGVTRRVAFRMHPAGCARPGRDCPIVVEGRVARSWFGMEAHRMAVQDRVDLRFDVRLVERP